MSITARRTSDGSRRYDVRLRDPVGHVYTRAFTTRRQAEAFAARENADRSRGAWVDPRRGDITLEEWATRWLEQRDLRPTTAQTYRGLLRLHILPQLGQVELNKLSPSHVRAWHAELRRPEGTRGALIAAKCYRLLRAILQTAVSDEVILRNPCQVERAGIERSPERPVASIAEVTTLADAIAPRYRLLVLLAGLVRAAPR